MPANCLKVDSIGLCIQCIRDSYQIIQGQCVFIQKCSSSQFQLNGQCIDAPANCSIFNPNSGVCLTCIDGSSANGGLCCLNSEVAFNGKCVTQSTAATLLSSAKISVIPICLIYHPTTGYCLQCNDNYSVDPKTMKTCI